MKSQFKFRRNLPLLAIAITLSPVLCQTVLATDATWTGGPGATTGAWTDVTNPPWDNSAGPSGEGAIATFNQNFTGAQTVTANVTLGVIHYTDTASGFTNLQLAAGTITFDNTGTTAGQINYSSGTSLLWLGNGVAGDLNIAGSNGLAITNANTAGTTRLGTTGGNNNNLTWTGFSGALTLNNGGYFPQKTNQLPQGAGSYVVLGTADTTLNYITGRNQSVVGLEGVAGSKIDGTGSLTLGVNAANGETHAFNGNLQIGGSLTMNSVNGATQVIAGTNNTYVGNAVVTGGTLRLGHSTALGGAQTATLTTTAASTAATVDNATNLFVGQLVTGPNVAVGTYISVLSGTTVTLSQNATADGAASSTFAGISKTSGTGVIDLNGQTTSESFGNTVGDDGLSGASLGGNGALVNSSGTLATISGSIYTNAGNAIETGKNGFVVGSGDIVLTGRIDRRNAGVTGMGIKKIGSGTLTIGGAVANGAFNDLWLDGGTVVLAKTGAITAVGNVTLNGGTLKMDPANTTSPANPWQGQIGNGLTFGAGGGTWDLNDTAGNNNRLKGVSGTTGSITNTGIGTALLNLGMRDNNALWNFSGTITDGTNGGTVGITTTNGGFGTGQVQVLGGNNTFSAGSTLTFGTLRMAHDNALGTGWVKNTATLDINGHSLGNVILNNGNGGVWTNSSATTATVSEGFNKVGAGSYTISDFTVNGTGDINWSGAIRRTNFIGSITKSGTNTLTLSGAGADYTNMNFTVSGGTLALALSGGNFTSGTITVDNGAFLGLALGNTITSTNALTLTSGAKIKVSGTPALSSYTLITASSVTGTPELDAPITGYELVLDGNSIKLNSTTASGFSTWAGANGATGQSSSDDHDGDGVPNGVEYFMGQTGSSFTSNPALNGANTVTWPKSAGFTDSYRVETSTNLSFWTDVTAGAVDNGSSVSYTLTGAGKQFVRLVVIAN